MNSLEGYPRYVGVDFFACRNAWVNPAENQKHLFPTFFFGIEEENLEIRRFKSAGSVALTFTHIINTHQFQHLLRKTKIHFLRLGTSCAAMLIFILHIFSPVWVKSGPRVNRLIWGWDFCLVLHKQNQSGLYHQPRLFSTVVHVLVDPPGSVWRGASACKKVDFSVSWFHKAGRAHDCCMIN